MDALYGLFCSHIVFVDARANDPSVLAAVDVFESTSDVADFRDSLQRIAKLALKSAGDVVVTPTVGLSEADKAVLLRACRAAGVSDSTSKQLVELAQSGDVNVTAALQVTPLSFACMWSLTLTWSCCVFEFVWQVFSLESDFADLVDTLRRIAQRLPSSSSSSRCDSPSRYQVLSDLAATGQLSGLRYRSLLHLLRSGDDATAAAFEAFDDHRSKPLLCQALCTLADEAVASA